MPRRWSRIGALTLACLLGPHAMATWGAAAAGPSPRAEPDTAAWDRVLAVHQEDGGLDYAALAGDRGALDAYLTSIRAVDPTTWSPGRRLAFWINAYNAVVAARVLERYPDLDSVRSVDGFFDTLTAPVAGGAMTLDQIETAAREIGDPRVHFAVVCASTSCPDLRGEAYREELLDSQLEDQTRGFLADTDKGLRWDRGRRILHLSAIFKWYAGDFTGGSTVVAFFARGRVLDWVLMHLPGELAEEIGAADPAVRYLDYDWSLNDR